MTDIYVNHSVIMSKLLTQSVLKIQMHSELCIICRTWVALLSVVSECLSVCVSGCQHDNSWTIRDIITKFSGHHPMVERADKLENGYTGVHGWW